MTTCIEYLKNTDALSLEAMNNILYEILDEIKNDESNTENVSENNSDKVDNNISLEKTEVISDNSLISTEKKSNKKVLLITLLSILLVIDVAALVIYLIGIEKVISFIK